MSIKQIYLPLFMLLSLTYGCTPYSESFDCPPGHGVGCKSLSQVNQLVETGKLPLEDKATIFKEDSQPRNFKRPSKNRNHRDSLIEAKQEQGPINILPQSVRAGKDEQLRIWIASFEDEGDLSPDSSPGSPERIYHAPSYVYVSLQKSTTE